jgi:hypothetical protein
MLTDGADRTGRAIGEVRPSGCKAGRKHAAEAGHGGRAIFLRLRLSLRHFAFR